MVQDFLLELPTLPDKHNCLFRSPPLDGSLTIPELYDWHFINNPTHPVFVYHSDTGLVNLSFSTVVPAIYKAAHYVELFKQRDHRNITNGPPVAILANTNTPTYFCLILGMMQVGIPSLPISPQNSPLAIAHLLQIAQVNQILIDDDPAIQILAKNAIDTFSSNVKREKPVMLPMPTYHDLFPVDYYSFLPGINYRRTKHWNYENPVIYVHSSGSSSLPKLIPWNHASLLQVAVTPYLGAFDLRGEIFDAHAVPMFHARGLNFIPWVAAAGFIMAVFPPIAPVPQPTPENVLSGLISCNASYLICVPSFLEAWSTNPDAVQNLKNLKAVACGGGPLAESVGNHLIAQGVKLIIVMGSTEAGVISALFSEYQGRDWQYFSINPHCNAKFIPQGDGTYELVVVKQPTQVLSVANTKFEGVDACSSKDLCLPHPEKAGYWTILGRTSDQIILCSGVKINPGPLEAILSQHPLIDAAVMFGSGRFQSGVIIFPITARSLNVKEPEECQRFLDEIWDQIAKMNSFGQVHSRIFRETVLLASPDKPLLLTSKRTIRRGAILEAYEKEIEEMYQKIGLDIQKEM